MHCVEKATLLRIHADNVRKPSRIVRQLSDVAGALPLSDYMKRLEFAQRIKSLANSSRIELDSHIRDRGC